MTSFAFVGHAELRQALEADHRELEQCLEVGAWKAAVVLGGAIIEAILTDHLVAASTSKATVDKILAMTLGQLIAESRKQGALTAKTVSLSDAVKEYRNLIHPGREIRLADRADEDSALVVRSLVNMISGEIADQKRRRFGLTAEQLLQKLETDPSVGPILGHLLKELSGQEVARLVLELIPDRILELDPGQSFGDFLLIGHLRTAHRAALTIASEETRGAAARKVASVLKEGAGDVVAKY